MDDKSAEAFRTISEAATALDLPQHVLRFWETRFPQIKPLKRGGGRRYYRPDDVELLRAIKRLLYDEGYTIKGVQKMLREQGAGALADPPAAAPAREPKPPRPAPAREPAAPAPVERESPGVEAAPAPRPPSPAAASPSGEDLAALRAALADLREAERILSQARQPPAGQG